MACALPPAHGCRLPCLPQELFTDDNFQFSRAAKSVREAVEGLPCVYPALDPPGAKHLPEAERPAWRDAIFDCGEACMLHHKHLWAKTTADMVVKAMVDRRQNFSEEQQRTLQEISRVGGDVLHRLLSGGCQAFRRSPATMPNR